MYLVGANGGEAYLMAYWDDRGYDENGENPTDPTADMMVRGIRYKNMTESVIRVQRYNEVTGEHDVLATAEPGTPETTFDPIPQGQRVSIQGRWMFG